MQMAQLRFGCIMEIRLNAMKSGVQHSSSTLSNFSSTLFECDEKRSATRFAAA